MNVLKQRINIFLLLLANKLKAIQIKEKQNIQIDVSTFKIGKNSYGIENIVIDRYKGSDSPITIGKYCSIATNVTMITGGIHPVNWVSTYPFRAKFDLEGKFKDGMPYSNGSIIIGNDVWIGTGVTILSGITIGDGAVLAANALITKDVPAYTVVGGNPATIIKIRFTEDQIEKLEKIKWWDWEEEKIKKAIPLLSSKDIGMFIEKYKI